MSRDHKLSSVVKTSTITSPKTRFLLYLFKKKFTTNLRPKIKPVDYDFNKNTTFW